MARSALAMAMRSIELANASRCRTKCTRTPKIEGAHYHIDQNYLRDAQAAFLLELLLHEVVHRWNLPGYGGLNALGGYDAVPHNWSTPGTKPEPNSCVIR